MDSKVIAILIIFLFGTCYFVAAAQGGGGDVPWITDIIASKIFWFLVLMTRPKLDKVVLQIG